MLLWISPEQRSSAALRRGGGGPRRGRIQHAGQLLREPSPTSSSSGPLRPSVTTPRTVTSELFTATHRPPIHQPFTRHHVTTFLYRKLSTAETIIPVLLFSNTNKTTINNRFNTYACLKYRIVCCVVLVFAGSEFEPHCPCIARP